MAEQRSKGSVPRRVLEAAGWIAIVTVLWGTDLVAKLAEREQSGIGKESFRLVTEQVTSAVAVLIMILFVLHWLRLFPLERDKWVPAVIGHTVGTVLFAFGHQMLMIAMRAPWYALNDMSYTWREPFVSNLFVEYQKDIKVYIGIVVIATAYGLYRRAGGQTTVQEPGRLLVQTGTGDAVLRVDEIDYLEASRNYVSIFAGDREYIVRDTMKKLAEKLADGGFVRTHRSFIVNVDRVREIRTADSSFMVVLEGDRQVPLSRGYRDELLGRFQG